MILITSSGQFSLSAAVPSSPPTPGSHQPPPPGAAELSPVSTNILREEKFSGHGVYISLRASREITHI